MKIAFVGGFAFSPKGTMRARAHPLAAELVKAGHEVTMFLPPYDNPQDCGREWEEEGVRIKNVAPRSSSANRNSRLPKRKYPRLLIELIREVDRFRADVIHVFKAKGFAGAAGTYFLFKKAPVVVDCDDWEGWGGWNDVKPYAWIVKEYIDRQERWMIRRGRAVTVASRALEDRAAKLRGSGTGIFYLPNCGATAAGQEQQASVRASSQMEIRKELGIPEGQILLYSGHAGDERNISALCRAVTQVARDSKVALVLVGNVAPLEPAERLLCMKANVALIQFPQLSYREFLRVVWASDIAVFPYFNDGVHRAKCSARIVDYMAMGKPVLTYAIGENLEYIVHNESGLLVDDEQEFASELGRLLSSPELRDRLGNNARARIASKFQWSGEPLRECLAAYGAALNSQTSVPPYSRAA